MCAAMRESVFWSSVPFQSETRSTCFPKATPKRKRRCCCAITRRREPQASFAPMKLEYFSGVQSNRPSKVLLEGKQPLNSMKNLRYLRSGRGSYWCACCGDTMMNARKPQYFCSHKCHNDWWNSHQDELQDKRLIAYGIIGAHSSFPSV